MLEVIIVIVLLAIAFQMSNGWNDSAHIIAPVVSTRILSPMAAVSLAAIMNVLGAFLSTAVAKTIGKGVVDPSGITEIVVASALLSGLAWNAAMTRVGTPVSASYALIGSLLGASVAFGGLDILQYSGLAIIFLALLISPILGIFFGYYVMRLILNLFGTLSPGTINRHFGRLQLFSSSLMAFSHGSNDTQKVMGILTLALISSGHSNSLDVPLWVVLICALAMGVGTALGGRRIVRTRRVRMLKLEPVAGFAAETSASLVVFSASLLGLPVSTTHVLSTSIMGVGATRRLSAVRWGIAGKIIVAWIFTLPMTMVMAWLICKAALSIF